jgi:hypothetical protein
VRNKIKMGKGKKEKKPSACFYHYVCFCKRLGFVKNDFLFTWIGDNKDERDKIN